MEEISGRIMNCDDFKIWIMGYIDGELNREDREKVEAHLDSCSQCRSELEKYQKLEEVTKTVRLNEPSDEEWEKFWSNIYNRIERKAGWFLLIAGISVLAAYSIYRIAASPKLSPAVKSGTLLLLLGFIVLFISVLRGHFALRKFDQYRDVQR